MTQDIEIRQDPVAVAKALQSFAQRSLAIQAEFAKSLLQVNRHWLERARTEWSEALELIRRLVSNETTAEKVDAMQTWLKGAVERGMDDANHAVDVARALGGIELRLFEPSLTEQELMPPASQGPFDQNLITSNSH